DQEARRRERNEALDIRSLCSLVSGLRDPRQRHRKCEDPHRNVDEEDPPPPERVRKDAPDERSAGDRSADGGAPDGERAESLGTAVLVADERERRCERRSAADADVEQEHERRQTDGDKRPLACAHGFFQPHGTLKDARKSSCQRRRYVPPAAASSAAWTSAAPIQPTSGPPARPRSVR